MSRQSPKAFATLLQNAVNEPGILLPGLPTVPHLQDLKRRERLTGVPVWDLRCRNRIAVGLAQDEPARLADEPGHDVAGFVGVGLGDDRGPLPLHGDRHAERDRLLALLDLPAEGTPAGIGGHWARLQAVVGTLCPGQELVPEAEILFDHVDGNCLGFARDRVIAINPINPLPHKTRFHELAHVLLGHTTEGRQADSETTPRTLRECEAEAVALLCCAALELPGVTECCGYIQHWWGQGHEIPERSAQRVLKVADQILKAGTNHGASS